MAGMIAFLGCGEMNEAILAGLLKAGTAPEGVVATVRRAEHAAELRGRYPGVTFISSEEDPDGNRTACGGAAVVVLGVKPGATAELARAVSPALRRDAVVVSVAAALPLAQLEAALPEGQPVVRSMPNTPLKVGRGIVSLSPGSSCGPEHLERAGEIFRGSGTVVEVPEEQIALVSAISGSGPAYAYYLAETMADAGVELGLEPGLAELLARETVAGAGWMLSEPGATASTLRQAMTGPETITSRAINVFNELGMPGIVAEGARATVRRTAEITAQLDGDSRPPQALS
jgi:pyrroline-5-carboxylate reductase